MGRTLRTFNDQLEQEMRSWAPFRAALRREDQQALDKLFAYTKRHMAEAQNACRALPLEAVLVCAMIELVKENDRLREERTGGGGDAAR